MRLNRTVACVITAGGYLALRLLVLLIHPEAKYQYAALFLYPIVLMLAQVAFVVSYARIGLSSKRNIAIIVPSALLLAALIHYQSGVPTGSSAVALSVVSTFHALALMLFAASLGYLVSFIVREVNLLLPVALFAGVMDAWNVFIGPLGRLIQSRPDIIEKVSVQMPSPVAAVSDTLIGMGDFLFLALYFAVLYRYSMNVKGAFWLVYVLLALSMIYTMFIGGAVPALVPMGIGILIANIKRLRLTRQESLSIIFTGTALIIILIAVTAFFHIKASCG